MLYSALKRNASQGFLDDWILGYQDLDFDPLREAQSIVYNCEKCNQGILFIIILYCLVHECFTPKFILNDTVRFKLSLSYWLAKGNYPI